MEILLFKWLYGAVRPMLFYLAIKIALFGKISFIVGSQMAFFSASSVLHPLGGCFLGASGLCLSFGSIFLVRLFLGMSPHLLLIHCLPGFCAALYVARPSCTIRLLLPLGCMILFMIHPVGWQAAPYALYWLIPIIISFVNNKSFFVQALGATFVAHAVGSVGWLYCVPMTASSWWVLIPIVAIERFTFAAGAFLIYQVAKYSKSVWEMVFVRSINIVD